jgi:hypothetical protein
MATLQYKYERSRKWSPIAGMKHIREKKKFYPLQCLVEAR